MSASYASDVLGRRQAKVVNGVSTYFLSDGSEEIAELDGSGALLRRYIAGPGTDMPIAMATPNGSGGHVRLYVHANRQGSVVAMSDEAGAIAEGPYTYDPYGNGAPATGFPFKYTGRRLDPETGLYYYRARYYSSALGRFLQTYPIGTKDQMNLYGYVGNDPLNATDPSGEFLVTLAAAAVGAAVAAGSNYLAQKYTGNGQVDSSKVWEAAAEGGLTGAMVANGVPPAVATAAAAAIVSVGSDVYKGKVNNVSDVAKSGAKAVLKAGIAVTAGQIAKAIPGMNKVDDAIAKEAGFLAVRVRNQLADGIRTYEALKSAPTDAIAGASAYGIETGAKPAEDMIERGAEALVNTGYEAFKQGEEAAQKLRSR